MNFHQFAVDLHGPPARAVGLRLFQFRRQFLLSRFQFRDFFFQCGDAFLNSALLPRTRLSLLGLNSLLCLAVNLQRRIGGTSSTSP